MDLFTVSLPASLHDSIEQLQSLLTEHTNEDLHNYAHADAASGGIARYDLRDGAIQCQAILPGFQLKFHGGLVYKSASRAIAEFVMQRLESKLLSAIVNRKYKNNPSMDTAVIEQYCHELLHGKDWEGLGGKFHEADRIRRRGKIAEDLEHYLQEQTELNLEGFTTFRLHAYRSELAEIVEYALDEYVLDKQYQEFISLLKYFVQMQESKVPLVHLLHKGGPDFAMYNESFQTLEHKPPADRIVAEMLETEMNIEDMVISSLISVSPKQITIHTRQPELQVIRTIETIFDGRVNVCVQCSSCASTLDEWIQP
ncbi:putative sporulation protein YtxC [Paenibacillus sp. LHD-117]|uniref:putative sporulation protein YtxC n=1 Tax=Paenibacillus sp. LHD-117 TaxID=3071412 RepID=UPI0027DFC685|nr:putative sporulation protein YtxC [Paenibacillus sp. LHD-117]MDQ6419913.1 putative sporulation protein YtxC [Paenibacillus sp. LHD-117]